ncbi:MAG: ABC transporter substrate-binding protein [Acidimicrobiales bacterium]|nr:ABC transporter substrate-binding protein [Acidimicrobiales bacterium]
MLCALALMLAGCSSADDDDGVAADGVSAGGEAPVQPQTGGALVVGTLGEVDGFLPPSSRWSPSAHMVAKAIFDPLATYDVDGKARPYVLESWTARNDFTQWDLKMRPGVGFHDATPADAEALAANLEAYRTGLVSSTAYQPVTAVEVIDDLTVRVTTDVSWAQFPILFTTQGGYLVAPSQLAAGDADRPVGTGPFVFQNWTKGDNLVVARNTQYWRSGLPYLERVEFRPIVDADTRRNALDAGDVDMIQSNAFTDFSRARNPDQLPEGLAAFENTAEAEELWVGFNTQTGPFADLRLRRALALATDRPGINDLLYDGLYEIVEEPYGAASPWYVDVEWPEYDPAEATRLVEEWEAENGPAAITLTVVANQEDLTLAQALQDQWGRVGVETTIDSQEETKFSLTLVTGDFDAIGTRIFNASDPDGDFIFYTEQTLGEPGAISLNFARYTNGEVEQALLDGRANEDDAYRRDRYAVVWQDWAENIPYLWLFQAKWTITSGDRVRNVGVLSIPDFDQPAQPIQWGSIYLTEVWLERA